MQGGHLSPHLWFLFIPKFWKCDSTCTSSSRTEGACITHKKNYMWNKELIAHWWKWQSQAWKYCLKGSLQIAVTNSQKATCKWCYRAFPTKQENTSSLAKHLKDWRPNLFKEFKLVWFGLVLVQPDNIWSVIVPILSWNRHFHVVWDHCCEISDTL